MGEDIKQYIVKWDNEAKKELREIYGRIKYKSVQNAKLVKERILSTTKGLKTLPERYEVYEPMRNIPGNYHYKEVSSYLIIYDVTDTEVHIVKVVHRLEEK